MIRVRSADLLIATLIVIADQVTKAIVRLTLPLHGGVNIVPGLLDFTHVRNSGAAFGFLNAAEFPFKPTVILVVAVLALVAIGVYAARLPAEDKLARVGLALILGGAIGNLIDRTRSGYVIDFVDVYWRDYHFWAFNVADASITIGAGLTILEMLTARRHHVSKAV